MTAVPAIPGHIAIVMDGNGRWAKMRNRPRSMGHQAGLKALRSIIEHCAQIGVGTLTVFAFSSENWKRPAGEVAETLGISPAAVYMAKSRILRRLRDEFAGLDLIE